MNDYRESCEALIYIIQVLLCCNAVLLAIIGVLIYALTA